MQVSWDANQPLPHKKYSGAGEGIAMLALSTFLLGLLLSRASAQLRVVTLPNILFQNGNANHKIVSGSVIQLYCSATSMTATPNVTWASNGVNLANDPPHIRIRSSSNNTEMYTTSSLTIDNFTPDDDGNYVCHVTDGSAIQDKSTLIINAFSTFTGVLRVTRDPATREAEFEDNMINPLDNRTAVTIGSTVDQLGTPDYDNVLRCECGHVGDETNFNFLPPSVVWIKNGEDMVTDSRITITDSGTFINNVRRASILRISNFQLSDVGVYQCIFIDVDSDREVTTTTPLRLDTGDILQMERVSPENIILNPPEKLVVEARASGGYRQIQWRKNGVLFNTSRSDTFFVRLPDEFSSFFEIFAREPTTMHDQGLYEVFPLPANSEQTEASPIHYVVTLYDVPITTSQENTTVTVLEGDSTEISCTSSGNPIPTISWELRGSPALFPQSDTVTTYRPTVPNLGEFSFTAGSVTSVLKMTGVNASHEGEYTCTGRNSHRGVENSADLSITLRVLVIPVIEVTASLPVLQLGDSITLTCNVIRAKPTEYTTLTWTHDSTALPETGNTLTLSSVRESDLGVYRCEVTNSAGTGSQTFNLVIGAIGTPTVISTGSMTSPTTSTESITSLTTIVGVVSTVGGGIIVLLVTVIIILIVAISVMGRRKLRIKRTDDKDDSKLIPFEEMPPFGFTPADDQYIYGQQGLNWNEHTLTFGEDISGENAFGRDALGEVAFGEDTFDEHPFDEHMFDETPTLIN